MKLTKALLLFLMLQNLACVCFGQQNLVYNHYFVNPYLYNPSYLANNGYTELFLNYRKSWGDYRTATANLQVPINYKIGVGASFANDQAGIYKTNTGYLSFSYQVHFGKDFSRINRLGFGLSAGFTSSRLDMSEVSNPDDPAYRVTSASGIQGQFGVNYQFQNLKIGFALPRLLKSVAVTSSPGDSMVSPFENTIATASYNFQLSERIAIEPYVLYRIERNMPSQFEVAGILRIDNIGWIGGAYRQEYGASAFLGLNIKEKIKVGYAYEFAPNQVTGIGGGSHEVQLIVRLSKKKKERPVPAAEKVEENKVEEAEIEEEKVAETEVQPEEVTPLVVVIPQPDHKTEEPVTPEPIEEKKEAIIPVNPEAKPETKQVTKSLDGEALAPGHYVVVGVFRSVQNAKTFARTLKKAGYPAGIAYNPENAYYIVHMGVTPSHEEAQRLRDIYRQKSRYSFRDTWILSIE